jgi:hypothetical protein
MRTITQDKLDGKTRTQQLHKPKPKVETPTPVVAPKVEVAAPIINVDMSKFAEDNNNLLKTIAEAVKTQQPAPTKASPTEWVFEIQRDSNNLIKSITAKAK